MQFLRDSLLSPPTATPLPKNKSRFLEHISAFLSDTIMADRQPQPQQRSSPRPTATTFLRRVREHSRNSTHLMGILTLLISGGILLLLNGLTMTVSILALIFFAPVILITSPIWIPVAITLLVAGAGFVLFCGSGVAGAAAVAWLYKYFKGSHPPGSDRFDYARSRLVDTASHVKDYARDYGGFLHSKVKDAAPGA